LDYQAEAQRLEDQATVTEDEKKGLEELQLIYEAVKRVKKEIVLEDVAGRLASAKQATGLDGLAGVAEEAADRQQATAKKMQEFPGDEETSLALTAAETEMHLLYEELERLANSEEVSVRETESILALAQTAREKEAYNRLYAEALPIARGGDAMELEMYFEALETQFQAVETDYNWAVAENMPEAYELGLAFDKALLDFNAALDVQFDVVEAVGQEQLIPEVELTEEEEDDLMLPVSNARAIDGGAADIYNLLKRLFDDVTSLEIALHEDKEDRDTQDALARAKKVYDFTKEYAASTASKQEGEVVEETQAAGAYVKQEIEIDESEAAELEAMVEAQRAAEQAAI